MHPRIILSENQTAVYKGFYINPNGERNHVRLFISAPDEAMRLTEKLRTLDIPYTLESSGDSFISASLNAAANEKRKAVIERDYACLHACNVVRVDNLKRYLYEVAQLLPADKLTVRSSYDFLMVVREFTDVSAYDFSETFFDHYTRYAMAEQMAIRLGWPPLISQQELMLFCLCKKPSDEAERNRVLAEINTPAANRMG